MVVSHQEYKDLLSVVSAWQKFMLIYAVFFYMDKQLIYCCNNLSKLQKEKNNLKYYIIFMTEQLLYYTKITYYRDI